MSNSVVYQESANNFTDNNQTIMGQAIVSVQFSPNAPSGIPTRVGVLHIQIPEGAEDKQLHAWLALAGTPNNEWVSMNVGSGGDGETPADVVRTSKENDFTVAKQTIGENQIVTIIDGGANSTPSGTADFDGQVFFSYRDLGTADAQGAIWVAKGNQWLPVASGGSGVDDDTIARTDRSNTFTDLQKIGSEVNMATFTSGRRTHLDPLDAASPDMMPFAAGDTIIREYNDGAVQHEVYIATEGSDADSWLKIYDSTNNTIQLEADIVALDGRLDTLSDKLDLEMTDLDNLSNTVGDLDLAMTGVEGDIALVGTKVDLIEPRVIANETKIAALETHFNPDSGLVKGETHVHPKSLGVAIPTYDGTSITRANAVKQNVLFCARSSGNMTVDMPLVCAATSEPDANSVREGAMYSVINVSANEVVLQGSGLKYQTRNGSLSTLTVPAKTTFFLFARHIASQDTWVLAGITHSDHELDGHAEIDTRFTTIEAKVTAAEEDIATLETSVASAIGTGNSNTTSIETLTSSVDSMETSVATLTTKVTTAESTVAEMEDTVNTVNTDMITVKSQVGGKLDKTGGTVTGKMILSSDSNEEAILVNKPSGKAGYIRGKRNNANNWHVGNGSSNNDRLSLHSDVFNKGIVIDTGGIFARYSNTDHEIYHAGNKPTAADVGARPDTWTPSAADMDINAPATLTAKRYLIVNDAGTEVVMSSESTDDVEALAALGAGVVSGDACISTKCLGGETTILSGTSNSISTSKSNFIFGTPSSTVTYTLGDIIAWDSTDLGNNKVREGCMITVANCGTGTMRLAADGATRFQTREGTKNNIDIASWYTFMLMPQIWEDGTKVYNIIGVVSSAG